MRVVKLFFLVCFVFILSCTSVARKNQLYIQLTGGSKFILLPTRGIGQDMDMTQYMSVEFRGHNYFLNTWVKADENAVEMVLFNELGVSMGELSYRDGVVNFSSTVIPGSVTRSIKPEYAIADFQFCFYDPILLGKALENSGLVLEIQDDGSRRILNGNEVIIEIIKTGNTVRYKNHLRGYAYTLEGDFHGIR